MKFKLFTPTNFMSCETVPYFTTELLVIKDQTLILVLRNDLWICRNFNSEQKDERILLLRFHNVNK